ncbi:AraC family transcriptional regulator [Streptomyces sp. NPDC001657]|uniref:helix-turn-helix transcriptional regulator n=1 Tax=Streptomyces sp. NPDC001657 TaxID=3154522 RepID=UPI00332CE7DB
MCLPEWGRARIQAQRLSDLKRLRRVRDRIDGQYAQPLNVEALARDVNMSAGHLSRQFRAAYGESPYAYLTTRRIERATALLRRGDLGVTEVCLAVGCTSLSTFTTRFTELVKHAARGLPTPGDERGSPCRPVDATHEARVDRALHDATSAMAVEVTPARVAQQWTTPVRNREVQALPPRPTPPHPTPPRTRGTPPCSPQSRPPRPPTRPPSSTTDSPPKSGPR